MNNYYMRGGRVDYGIGGALLKLGSNLASGKGFGKGALKGVGKAAVTPGSGIGAGVGLAGNLLQKSKNPALQGIGKAAGVASNFMPGGGGIGGAIGALAGGGGQGGQGGGGGFLQNAAGMLGGGQGGGGGMLQNLAGNAGQGGGGGLLNMAQGFLGAEQGVMVPRRMQGVRLMKRPMAEGGMVYGDEGMVYGDGGMIYADNGVVTPKKKEGTEGEPPPLKGLTDEEFARALGVEKPVDLDASIASSGAMPQASSNPQHAGFGGSSTDVAMPGLPIEALLPPITKEEEDEEDEEKPTPPGRMSTLDPLKPAPIPLDREPRLIKGERREIPKVSRPDFRFETTSAYGQTPESGHISGSGSSGPNYDASRAGQPGGVRLVPKSGEGPSTGYDLFYLPGATGVAEFGDTPTSIRTLPSGREDVTSGDRSIDSAGYKNITDIYDLYGEDAYMTALGKLQAAGVDIDKFDLPIDFDRPPRLVGTKPSQGSVLKSRATRSSEGRVVSGTGRLGDPAFTGGTSKMAREGRLGSGQRDLQDYFKRMAEIAREEYGPDSKEAKEAEDLIAQNQSVGGHVMRPRGVRAIKR